MGKSVVPKLIGMTTTMGSSRNTAHATPSMADIRPPGVRRYPLVLLPLPELALIRLFRPKSRLNSHSDSSTVASSTPASAEANPQFSSSVMLCEMSSAAMRWAGPPISDGVM